LSNNETKKNQTQIIESQLSLQNRQSHELQPKASTQLQTPQIVDNLQLWKRDQ